MSWAVGTDSCGADIGYGVPAYCDQPDCTVKIDRGLGYVCGDFYDDEVGCGLHFCVEHGGGSLCERCETGAAPFQRKPDHPEWVNHKLTHDSWAQWRAENPGRVAEMRKAVS